MVQKLAAEYRVQPREEHLEFVRELLLIMNYFASSTPSMNLTFTDMVGNLKAGPSLIANVESNVDDALPVFRNAVDDVMKKFEANGWHSAVASHGCSWDNVCCYYCVLKPPKKSKGNELIRLRCVGCHSAGAHNNCAPKLCKSTAAEPKPWVCPLCVTKCKCDGAAEGLGANEGLGATEGRVVQLNAVVQLKVLPHRLEHLSR